MYFLSSSYLFNKIPIATAETGWYNETANQNFLSFSFSQLSFRGSPRQRLVNVCRGLSRSIDAKTPPALMSRGCSLLSGYTGLFMLGAKIERHHHGYDDHHIVGLDLPSKGKDRKHCHHRKCYDRFHLDEFSQPAKNLLHTSFHPF